jgi:hypothetical protein
MSKQKIEIECPICDAKSSFDARSCPRCGADLGMADFQDLEDLANDIAGIPSTHDHSTDDHSSEKEMVEEVEEEDEEDSDMPEEVVEPSEPVPAPEVAKPEPVSETLPVAGPKEERKIEIEENDSGKKKGLFSKLFGKKK